ncbi:cyanophycin synthetase [uncultured Endozoicomonas sp.]|uniref:cyanophycin synthetase n=1 Tax=uncultured Endozoicomonas sp. TaxID=432652 RepID=UPI00262D9E06|nr:cyanophycin synthetase [uncultured Endozoicomonas sp.]
MKILKRKIYQFISKTFMAGCSNYNSVEVRRSCRSKAQARAVFRQYDFPHAKGEIFLNPFKAHKFAKTHGFPLVIKPNIGGFSRGSYFPIQNFRELWKAIFLAKIWWPTTVVEQYLEGKNYRALVANGQVSSIIQRYAPFVKGNGLDEISTLIDQENQTRTEMGLLECMYPLQKGTQTQTYLSKHGYTLYSIPEPGETVKLFHRIALAPGGVIRAIKHGAIHADNIELFENVLAALDARILGIDIIMEKGVEYSYKTQKCILLEVNSRPFVKMHDYPRYGERHDLSDCFSELDALTVCGSDTY